MRIGVFDSGVGGITVLLALRKQFPRATFIYYGDTAHVPYGSKSVAQIRKLALEGIETLKKQRLSALVVACNTVCSVAFDQIEQSMKNTPVIGVIAPGIEATLKVFLEYSLPSLTPDFTSHSLPILILGTRTTIRSHVYGSALKKLLNTQWFISTEPSPAFPTPAIIEQACPLIVPLIEEEGWTDHPILYQVLQEYLQPYLSSSEKGILILACTHYLWIQEAIQKLMPAWKIVNSAEAVAQALFKQKQLNQKRPLGEKKDLPKIEWIFSDPENIPPFARHLLKQL